MYYYETGDLHINHRSTLVFGIFYIYASILIFTTAFGNAVEDYTLCRSRESFLQRLTQFEGKRFGKRWRIRALKGPVASSDPIPANPPSMAPLPSALAQTSGQAVRNAVLNHNVTPGHVMRQSTPDDDGLLPGRCGKERFILLALIELGVIDDARHLQPLARVSSHTHHFLPSFLPRHFLPVSINTVVHLPS